MRVTQGQARSLLPWSTAALTGTRRARLFGTEAPSPLTRSGMLPTAPPPPTQPEPTEAQVRVEWRQKNRDVLYGFDSSRSSGQGRSVGVQPTKQRFWKEVRLVESKNADAYQIHLDSRPVRTPNREIMSIPKSKRLLAAALALEWDLLPTAQHAVKQHYIPLTSLIARALDLSRPDETAPVAEQHRPAEARARAREAVVEFCLRYLNTDTLLCWAPTDAGPGSPGAAAAVLPSYLRRSRRDAPAPAPLESLRDVQAAVAAEMTGALSATVWPGAAFAPALDGASIFPARQPEGTRAAIAAWLHALSGWELAGMELATASSKSILLAARLVASWSADQREQQRQLRQQAVEKSDSDGGTAGLAPFSVEDAYEAGTTEVRWQTAMWGEVEDTHDVDREDLRRRLGSVVMLLS